MVHSTHNCCYKTAKYNTWNRILDMKALERIMVNREVRKYVTWCEEKIDMDARWEWRSPGQ